MKRHTPPSRSTPAARVLLAFLTAASATGLQAANATWSSSPVDSTWANGSNWGGTAPGSTSALSTDIATFNSSLSGTIGSVTDPIVIDSGRRIGGISFGASAGAYVIGTNAGNTLTLGTRGAGYNGSSSIVIGSTTTASQIIAAPITFVQPSSTNGQYGLVNNATDSNVTLTLSGTMSLAATRPVVVVLDGSNTGNNTITGNISFTGSTQTTPLFIKRGSGTWILSGSNTMTGSAATSTNSNYGIQVLDGVLSLQNNLALGSSAQVWIGNKSTTYTYNSTFTTGYTSTSGGTLEVANGITLDNGLTLNLVNGGSIRSRGSNTVNSAIKLDTAAATTATLSTVNSGDIFTVGNAANDLTGGAADTTLQVSGPGTVLLSQDSNYAGNWSLNSGTTRLGTASALGAATTTVSFGSGSTAKLQLNGNSTTVGALSTNATVGTPVIENNSVTAATLTVGKTSGSTTYAGVIQDGTAGGALSLVKAGASTQVLTGANTYTGGTTISGGTLTANGSSALGTGSVTVGSGATLATSTVTLGNLNLGGGGILSLTDFNGKITSTGTVTISGTGNSLTIAGGAAVSGNTYTLLSANVLSSSGISLTGTAVNGLTIALGDTGVVGRTNYAFTQNGNNLQLAVTGGAFNLTWNGGNANWNATDANWQKDGSGSNIAFFAGDNITIATGNTIAVDAGGITAGSLAVTNASGTATLNGGSLTATSLTKTGAGSLVVNNPFTATLGGVNIQDGSVSLNTANTISGAVTVSGGSLVLNAANTMSGAITVSGGTLTLGSNNAAGSGSSTLTVSGGQLDLGASNQSLSNVTITSGSITGTTGVLTATGNAIDAQSGNVSAILGGTVGLTKSTSGTVILSGDNTYTGATTVSAGTLQIGNGGTTGSISTTSGITNNGTLNYNRSNDLTVGYVISGTGALVKDGAGTLILTNANTLSGATTVNSGTLQIGNGGTTGSLASSAITNNATVTFNRTDTINASGISGTGTVIQNGSGILNISGANTYSGGTTVNSGTLQITFGGSIAGNIALNNGSTFRLQNSGSNSSFVGNSITVAAGATTTFISSSTANGYSGNLTSGDANSVILVTGGANAFNFSASGVKQFTNFLGTVNVVAGSSMDARGNTHNNGGDNTTFQIDGFVGSKNAGTWTFGALTGASTGNLGGVNTYNIGAKGTNTSYDGIISSSAGTALVKVGSGKLTLNGANTYTGGTTISAGTLALGSTGSIAGASIVNNGTFDVSAVSGYTVGASQTLSGSGTVIGATLISGSLNPGNSPGVLTFNNNLTLAGTANFEINGATRGTEHDAINVGGTVTYGGVLNLIFGSSFLTGGENFALFNGLNGTDAPLDAGSFTQIELQGAYTASLTNNSGVWTGTSGGYDFTFTQDTGILSVLAGAAIPEPSTYAMLAGALGLAYAALRRRRA